ncbi:hypothetical protein PENSPDRAFT_746673 [Peniophora sp. CONT]|nr:hypothetical protein PENSPDRAFT_746673 [Peniophora sp. CONT]
MARATRSSNKNDEKPKENPPEQPKQAAKATGKKRKRISNVDPDEQPAAKLARNDTSIKEEEIQESVPVVQLGAGDVPLDAHNAQRILAILEKIDTQGLLDREFPLPSEALLTDPQPSNLPRTYSFRALLKDAPRHSLRVLHAAVKPLFPVFSHPRSRPSGPAAQQLKFCTLARQLLDQASHGLNPTVGALETLIPYPNDDAPSSSSDVIPHGRKYALMQKLPNGEWWSSLNSPASDPNELKDLITGHAELVAILPTPTGTLENTPKLGDYARPKASTSTRPLPGKPQASRRITTGAFLDYGPYASFAPTFDQDGSEIGRVQMGEVLWEDRKRKLARSLDGSTRRAAIEVPAVYEEDVEMSEPEVANGPVIDPLLEALEGPEEEDALEGLTGILPPEEVEAVRATLTELELEQGVEELLERTSKALVRLEELQNQRLGGPDGGKSKVDPDSEEAAVAESIHKSLALITSLRPRSPTSSTSLIPPSPLLRQLHRTLPVSPAPGWKGTLPAAKTTALHDDATIYVKPGTILNAPSRNSATPATPVPSTPSAAYKGTPGYQYQYPGYTPTPTAQYRPPQTGQYNNAQIGSYLNYAQQAGQTPTYPQYAAAAAAAAAATPSTATPTTATGQTQYYNNPQWYGATAQRAVANTVTPAKAYSGYSGNYTPTLAMRAAGPATPGTPTVQWGQQN